MNNIQDYIKKPEYDFLRNHPDLSNIIYLTLSGSHGYGTNTDHSDVDLRGCLIENKHYLFGLNSFEQFEDIPSDTVIYGLKKFVTLCTNANPNTLELLGTDESAIVMMSPVGKKLREHADLFLSQLVAHSFGNYATAQLRRLSNALCHDHYDEAEQEMHLRNSLHAQLEHFRETYTEFDEGSIHLYLDETATDQLRFDIQLQNYPLRDFVSIYSEMHNTVKTYHKLNHRNRKKDDAHLRKHAMHLIRLLITGMDILDGKGIITCRVDEHQFLMDLRNGCYTYPEIFVLADEYQKKFAESVAKTTLPKRPNMEKIEKLLMSLYEDGLR